VGLILFFGADQESEVTDMASTVIKTSRTDASAIHAAEVRDFVNTVRKALQLGETLSERGFRYIGSPADFAEFELTHGLSTGQGQTVFDMINGTLGAMKGTMQNDQAIELTERVV
jgi:hypothetical protein